MIPGPGDYNSGSLQLTKNAIIDQIWSQLSFSRQESIVITETLIEIIKSSLESGEDVLVSGFGKFCVNEKNERKGRNPATGENLMLKPRRVVTFKCSGKLKENLNG